MLWEYKWQFIVSMPTKTKLLNKRVKVVCSDTGLMLTRQIRRRTKSLCRSRAFALLLRTWILTRFPEKANKIKAQHHFPRRKKNMGLIHKQYGMRKSLWSPTKDKSLFLDIFFKIQYNNNVENPLSINPLVYERVKWK